MTSISIVIPAYNEQDGIGETIKAVKDLIARQGWEGEVIVVDDGSTDGTAAQVEAHGAVLVRHPMNGGYGLSLQHGITQAKHVLIAITDADGTYPIEEIPNLVAMVDRGFDMAVGARQGTEYRRGLWKYPARIVFRLMAEFVAGRRIPDINSGLRVFRRADVRPHLSSTCMGFSFTTSITLIYMLQGLFVGYRPIAYHKRIGNSKVRTFKDSLRTMQIMSSVIVRYNPIKFFLLIGLLMSIIAILLEVIAHFAGSPSLRSLSVLLFALMPVCVCFGFVCESIRLTPRD